MSDTQTEGISLVQLALLQRRLRAAQEVQIARALESLRQPSNGRDGKDGANGQDGRPGQPGKQGPPGEPGQPPAHQWQGTRLRFKRPDGNWGEWVDLRPKVAVYGGGIPGGPAWQPDDLPDAADTAPDQFIVRQNGTWVRATLAQMQGWLGGGTVTSFPVTVGGTPLTVGGQLVTVTE